MGYINRRSKLDSSCYSIPIPGTPLFIQLPVGASRDHFCCRICIYNDSHLVRAYYVP